MIIYIHGFGSSGFGGKALKFSDYFQSEGISFIAPSLSYVPILAINTLQRLIEEFSKYEKVHLIGSSLGGYYALYLANKYKLKAVLINPAVYPSKTLEKVGRAVNYYDMSHFECTKEHLQSLENFEVDWFYDQKRVMLLTQKGDEVIDFKEAVEMLPQCQMIVEEGGSHSFDGIERHFGHIEEFLS